MLMSFKDVKEEDMQQHRDAIMVAGILSAEEPDPQEAEIALAYFYSKPENKQSLQDIMERLFSME